MPRVTYIRTNRTGAFHRLAHLQPRPVVGRLGRTACSRSGIVLEVATEEWTDHGKSISRGPDRSKRCRTCEGS